MIRTQIEDKALLEHLESLPDEVQLEQREL